MSRGRADRPRPSLPFLVVVVLALLGAVRSLSIPRISRRQQQPCPTPSIRDWDPRRRMRSGNAWRRFSLRSASGGVDEFGLQSADSTSLMNPERDTELTVVRSVDAAGGREWEGLHNPPGRSLICSVCHRSFPSRNALFRHLRGQQDEGDNEEDGVSVAAKDDDGPTATTTTTNQGCGSQMSNASNAAPRSDAMPSVPFRVAVQFGYFFPSDPPLTVSNGVKRAHGFAPWAASSADRAASLIQQAIVKPLDRLAGENAMETERPGKEMAPTFNVTISSVTQATSAKLRAAGLRQEDDCSAANDVIVLSGDVVVHFGSVSRPRTTMAELRSMVEDVFVERIFNGIPEPNLRVDAVKFLDRPLHAEGSCTQYVYQYLMPAAWLSDPENEVPRWLGKERLAADARQNGAIRQRGGSNVSASGQRRPPALVRLKQALRSMESPRLDASSTSLKKDDSKPDSGGAFSRRRRVAAGRFGGLAYKARQAFHNYCDQRLMGAISPNHDVVWRCVDRARIVDFVTTKVDDSGVGNETAIVLEFRGDAFLRHQIRTLVGTALSMSNGWLPMDTTAPVSTSPEHIVAPLPCAPSGRLYLAATRFHFEELINSGKPLFDPFAGGRVILASMYRNKNDRSVSNMQWIQRSLLSQKARANEQVAEEEWLRFSETTLCSATRASLAVAADDSGLANSSSNQLSSVPEAFNHVLSRLRNIASTRSWPETTAARNSVIRLPSEDDSATMSMGSFTVVNPTLVDNVRHLGNVMFPELVNDVFALEQALSEQTRVRVTTSSANGASHPVPVTLQASSVRPPSTHCAINCNAQFTPHVDSGRGAGQSLSMIVGLGDYAGGDLVVEGSRQDIRYKAVEFDGWKLRHWTRPFRGERFSLVWFTPAMSASMEDAARHLIETQNS